MTLHKKGINYMGCCPFHNERTASFCVSPSKRIYKCFGCGKGGNVISFLTDGQGMTFSEACQWLGHKYNIEIPKKEMTQEEALKQSRRESITAVLSAAQDFFHEQLQKSPQASEYLFKQRKIDELTANTFGSGYAPKGWNNLYDYLKGKGFTDEFITAADLARKNSRGGMTDTFRNRITFPFRDYRGQIIGFTARTIDKQDEVKYLNSSDTPVFQKGRSLFGLFNARSEIVRQDLVIMCEGQFDVLSLSKAGIKNVVCGSSTALTSEQRKMLLRYTHNILLLYDGDKAGRDSGFGGCVQDSRGEG